jgi:hypothetical protein
MMITFEFEEMVEGGMKKCTGKMLEMQNCKSFSASHFQKAVSAAASHNCTQSNDSNAILSIFFAPFSAASFLHCSCPLFSHRNIMDVERERESLQMQILKFLHDNDIYTHASVRDESDGEAVWRH